MYTDNNFDEESYALGAQDNRYRVVQNLHSILKFDEHFSFLHDSTLHN